MTAPDVLMRQRKTEQRAPRLKGSTGRCTDISMISTIADARLADSS